MPNSKLKLGVSTGAMRALGAATLATLALGAAACSSPEAKLAKYLDSGDKHLDAGKLGLANVQFLNALKIDEENLRALEGLVAIAERKGDYQQMFGLLQKVNRVDPTNLPARINLAKLHLLANDAEKALEFADGILAENASSAEGLAVKAAIMFRLQNNSAAVEFANKALDVNPLSEEATAVLASERVMEKDFEGALSILDAAVGKNPKASVLQLLRVQVLGNLGRTDDINAA
jgi:tetratricopeptide (TPR) repeat protein